MWQGKTNFYEKERTEVDKLDMKIENNIPKYITPEYITTPEFNKLSTENFIARLKQPNLVIKTDLDKS